MTRRQEAPSGPILAVLAVFATCLALMPETGHVGDMDYWFTWVRLLRAGGLHLVYATPGDLYAPLWIYLLWVFAEFTDPRHTTVWSFKALALGFDLLTVDCVFSLVRACGVSGWHVVMLAGNLAFLYVTLFWGQIDGVYVALGVLAMVFICYRQMSLGMMAITLAVNIKPQALAFVPVLGMMCMHLAAGLGWRPLARAMLWATLVQALIALPLVTSNAWPHAWERLDRLILPRTTALNVDALNLWWPFGLGHPSYVSDGIPILGVSAHAFGLLVATLLVAGVLTRVACLLWQLRLHRPAESGPLPLDADTIAVLALAVAATTLSGYLFCTRMYERYAHAAIACVGIYAVLRGRWLLYAAVSLVYVAGLERLLRASHFTWLLTTGLSPQTFARSWMAIYAWLVVTLWQPTPVERPRRGWLMTGAAAQLSIVAAVLAVTQLASPADVQRFRLDRDPAGREWLMAADPPSTADP